MDAMSTRGYRDVRPIIDQNLRPMRIWQPQHTTHECRQLPRGQILFANLNPLDSLPQDACNVGDERINAAQRFPIGDVVTQHYSNV